MTSALVSNSDSGWLNFNAPTLRPIRPLRDALLGRFGENAHPLHPAVVHFVVGLLPLSFLMDFVAYVPLLHWFTGITGTSIHSIAYYLLAVGLFATGFSLLTGFAEFSTIPLSSPAFKPALTHASFNAGVFLVGLTNWASRRAIRGHSPSKTLLLLNFMTLFAMAYSVYLGGQLVYKYGTGAQRMGEGLKMKKKEELREESLGKANQ